MADNSRWIAVKESCVKDRLNTALTLRNKKAIDLAREARIAESVISQYRSGYTEPKDDKLIALANALKVNPSWLMGMNTTRDIELEHTLSDEEADMILRFRMADEIDKRAVKRILQCA